MSTAHNLLPDEAATMQGSDEAAALIKQMLGQIDPSLGLSTMSLSVYDTAWLALVSKTSADGEHWLFPESFRFVVESQAPGGGWTAHALEVDSKNDGSAILSTMAALYCIGQHISRRMQPPADFSSSQLLAQQMRGHSALARMLHSFDSTSCNTVGFEVLAPALLKLLEDDNARRLDFPCREELMSRRKQKLARLPLAMLYGEVTLPLVHSLEAFYGSSALDFDRLSHHKIDGSMMASPASTSAYLMKRSSWDDEAERYLRGVVRRSDGKGGGAVPSAFPSTTFEVAWVLATLLESRVWRPALDDPLRETVLRALDSLTDDGKSLVGFSPGISPDMDDSAKMSIVYSLLGRAGLASKIHDRFNGPECFKTYDCERDSSFSANCNALTALVHDAEYFEGKAEAIAKLLTFLCRVWRESGGVIRDKWNLSPYYPAMVLARALTDLLDRSLHDYNYTALPEDEYGMAAVTLHSCLARTLSGQHSCGTWGSTSPYEETSYALNILLTLQGLPWPSQLQVEAAAAVHRGKCALENMPERPEYLWIEKVPYQSALITQAYVLTAKHAQPHPVALVPEALAVWKREVSADDRSPRRRCDSPQEGKV